MGIALSVKVRPSCSSSGAVQLTFVEDITHRAVIQDHDSAEVWLDLAKILDVCAVPERTVLTIVPSTEVGPFSLQPVDHRISILLNRRRENDEIVPLRHLSMISLVFRTHKEPLTLRRNS